MSKEEVMNVLEALKGSYKGTFKDFEIIDNTIKLIENLIDTELKKQSEVVEYTEVTKEETQNV